MEPTKKTDFADIFYQLCVRALSSISTDGDLEKVARNTVCYIRDGAFYEIRFSKSKTFITGGSTYLIEAEFVKDGKAIRVFSEYREILKIQLASLASDIALRPVFKGLNTMPMIQVDGEYEKYMALNFVRYYHMRVNWTNRYHRGNLTAHSWTTLSFGDGDFFEKRGVISFFTNNSKQPRSYKATIDSDIAVVIKKNNIHTLFDKVIDMLYSSVAPLAFRLKDQSKGEKRTRDDTRTDPSSLCANEEKEKKKKRKVDIYSDDEDKKKEKEDGSSTLLKEIFI